MLTAACARVETAEAPSVADACSAADYQSLTGARLAAVTLPADLNIRIIGPGQVVTTDYDAERLNIDVDVVGNIIRVYCG